MSVPYAKNMAVEYADKTTKGIKIDDKLQSTDAAMELLQQVIDGKIGFDGEIRIDYTGYPVISNLSRYTGINVLKTSSGSYLDGIVILTKSNTGFYATLINTLSNADNPIYTGYAQTNDNSMTLTKYAVAKLYKHSIILNVKYDYDGNNYDKNIYFFIYSIATHSPITSMSSSLLYYAGKYYTLGIENYEAVNHCQCSNDITSSSSSIFYQRGRGDTLCDRKGFIILPGTYPGAACTVNAYDKDKIDLTTGLMASRVNLLSNVVCTFVSDTVTSL